MVPNPPRLKDVAKVIKMYGRDVVLVGNSEIRKALGNLISMGFLVEPTSATVYAAFDKIKKELRGLKILVPLTGSGLKMV